MKLSELFEDTAANTDQAFNMAWQNIRSSIPANYRSKVQGKARELMNKGESPSDALSLARTAVVPPEAYTDPATKKRNDTDTKRTSSQAQSTRDRVKPTITAPSGDRTRQDALGRNLKADRYYNQLNKSERGRNIIKKVSQKLGLPPEADEVIDHIADTMPTVIQKLDNILTNPADIGGRLNPRNRRK